MLSAAERAFQDDRLLTPADDNAYNYYLLVLEIVPDHVEASLGFERIVERYLALAETAIARELWKRAALMLDKAEFVAPHNDRIQALREQVALFSAAKRHVLSLTNEAVRQKSSTARKQLAEIGRFARNPTARVAIRASSDADGRWMYAGLNDAPGVRRIRGAIEIGRPPRVVVWILPIGSAPGAGD